MKTKSACEPDVRKELFRELYPFASHWYDLGRARMHYVDVGQGPVLLMIHACPMWSFEFRRLISAFSTQYRVIAIDQMGFGLSDKPKKFDYRIETHIDCLERFIKHLNLKNITFILHGRGAAIGMGCAIRMAEDVRAFAIMNAMAFSDFSLPWRLQICKIPWIGPQIVLHSKIFFHGMENCSQAVKDGYMAPFRDKSSEYPLLRFIKDIPCAPEDDSALSMFEIESGLWILRDKPMLMIWGGRDWLYGEECMEKWFQYFPNADVFRIKSAGRYLNEDAPEEIYALLKQFLTRVESQSPPEQT